DGDGPAEGPKPVVVGHRGSASVSVLVERTRPLPGCPQSDTGDCRWHVGSIWYSPQQGGLIMPRTPIALAVLSLSLLWHPVFAGPPEGPTGKMVVSDVVQLRDDVLRLEKEVERDNSDPSAAD